MINKTLLILFTTFFSALLSATEVVYEDGEQSFTTWQWQSQKSDAETVILLSGPTDHWNSDAAWWVSLHPALQSDFNVVAIERPSVAVGNSAPTLGYVNFATQVALVIDSLELKSVKILAFASSNMTVLNLIAKRPDIQISNLVLIDPDVLTEFSSARYKSDAKPFKDNLKQYSDYILEGKYTGRVEQKNRIELEHINKLQPQLSPSQQAWLQQVVTKRENLQNQVNLFREIAVYDEDLDAAMKLSWPAEQQLTIIDTDFEQQYIDNTDDQEAIQGLKQWRKDALLHYKAITNDSNKSLIEVKTTEHLYQVLAPDAIHSLLVN